MKKKPFLGMFLWSVLYLISPQPLGGEEFIKIIEKGTCRPIALTLPNFDGDWRSREGLTGREVTFSGEPSVLQEFINYKTKKKEIRLAFMEAVFQGDEVKATEILWEEVSKYLAPFDIETDNIVSIMLEDLLNWDPISYSHILEAILERLTRDSPEIEEKLFYCLSRSSQAVHYWALEEENIQQEFPHLFETFRKIIDFLLGIDREGKLTKHARGSPYQIERLCHAITDVIKLIPDDQMALQWAKRYLPLMVKDEKVCQAYANPIGELIENILKRPLQDGRDQIIHLLKEAGVEKDISSFLPASS
jgi:hypothetical protein